MKYKEQLQQPEWFAKRNEILKRDGDKCTCCGAEKSEYTGWTVSFEEASYQELSKKGYQLLIKSDYDNLLSLCGMDAAKVDFVSKIREPFNLNNLRFSERQWYDKRPRLVFYYSGESTNYRLGQLNIHHKYYISGKRAWEYDNDVLTTLCYDCHKEVHKKDIVEVRAAANSYTKSRFAKNCEKCEGTGYLPEFSHIDNGVCYPCDGRGCL